MTRVFVWLFVLGSTWASLWSQTTYRFNLIGVVDFPDSAFNCFGTDTVGGSDVWGYTAPDGSEYALMGVLEGVAVVKVPELQIIDVVPGPTLLDCYWHRDIKTYGHYAYVVSEMRGTHEGLMIIDLQFLPDSVHFVGSYIHGSDVRSHNLSIDVNTGYAYILKQNYTGFRIVDLSDPENPVDVHTVNTPDIHDVYARNDTVWVAEGFNHTFSIYEVSDKFNPHLIARVPVPNSGYVHNIWPTDDGHYALTTEETVNKTIKVWDTRDMTNITLVGQYLGANHLAHNVHVRGNLAIISHYAYGVVLVDITNPFNPVELDHYDTYPQNNNPGFWGCWGAFPFTQNGYVYASDFNGKLTVLRLEQVPVGIQASSSSASQELRLEPNFPNPFNPETHIRFYLPRQVSVEVKVYNLLGQPVRLLAKGIYPPGEHEVTWDGRDDAGKELPGGVYLYRLKLRGRTEAVAVGKMMLLK